MQSTGAIAMSIELNGKPGANFWIIGAAALVWNLIGLVFYFGHVTLSPDALAKLPEAQQDFLTSTPTWATAAFATGVNAGVLASLLLLLRKAWAVPLFVLSLIGIVVQDLHAFVLNSGLEVWGTEGIYLPLIVIVVAIALVVYSRGAKRKRLLT